MIGKTNRRQRHQRQASAITAALAVMAATWLLASQPCFAAPSALLGGLRARRAYVKERRADHRALARDARALRAANPQLDSTKARKEVAGWVRGRGLINSLAVLLSAAREQPAVLSQLSESSRQYLRGYLRLRKELANNEVNFQEVWHGELERTAKQQNVRAIDANKQQRLALRLHAAGNKGQRSRRAQRRARTENTRREMRWRDYREQRSEVAAAAQMLSGVDADHEKLGDALGKGKATLPPRRTSTAAKVLAGAQVALSAQTLWQLSQHLEGTGQGVAALACFVLGYMISDPTSAFTTHFPLDSYFFPNTKIFDSVARKAGKPSLWDAGVFKTIKKRLVRLAFAFQYHHDHPAALNQQSTAQIAAPVAPASVAMQAIAAALPFELAPVKALLTGLSNGLFIAQPSHVHAHRAARENSQAAQVLQKLKVFISSRAHGKHHHVPYPGNYAIVNGWSNKLLDKLRVFRKAEGLIYRTLGIIPNAWKEKGGAVIMRQALGDKSTHPALPPESYQEVKLH